MLSLYPKDWLEFYLSPAGFVRQHSAQVQVRAKPGIRKIRGRSVDAARSLTHHVSRALSRADVTAVQQTQLGRP